MNCSLKLTLAAALSTSVLVLATPAGATDFSCHEATTGAERAICSDRKLSNLDDKMATLYGRLWAVSGTRERLALRSYQHRFLAARDACGRKAACIHDAYLDQISVLSGRLIEASAEE